MTIFISLGHNKARNSRNIFTRDFGASFGGFREYDICKTVADGLLFRYKKIGGKQALKFIAEGYSLTDRIGIINHNAIDGDVCIELHMNAGGGVGTETFYYAGSEYARKKAVSVNNNLCRVLKSRDRGAKVDTATRFGRLGFVRDTKPLALLIELGFIDNEGDRAMVSQYGAQAVAEALYNTFG